jgi:hypothetical protein
VRLYRYNASREGIDHNYAKKRAKKLNRDEGDGKKKNLQDIRMSRMGRGRYFGMKRILGSRVVVL